MHTNRAQCHKNASASSHAELSTLERDVSERDVSSLPWSTPYEPAKTLSGNESVVLFELAEYFVGGHILWNDRLLAL
jgi:hypothetical protein